VSSLWTPDGEHKVQPSSGADQAPAGGPPPSGRRPPARRAPDDTELDDTELDDLDDLEPEEQARRLQELRRQIVDTPAEVVVANHVYGLFELAAIHLSENPPRRDQARLAVDAMGALVEGLAGRLGEAEPSLLDALAQIRLAYVQIGADPEDRDGADRGG
jgi:hypothetical protein